MRRPLLTTPPDDLRLVKRREVPKSDFLGHTQNMQTPPAVERHKERPWTLKSRRRKPHAARCSGLHAGGTQIILREGSVLPWGQKASSERGRCHWSATTTSEHVGTLCVDGQNRLGPLSGESCASEQAGQSSHPRLLTRRNRGGCLTALHNNTEEKLSQARTDLRQMANTLLPTIENEPCATQADVRHKATAASPRPTKSMRHMNKTSTESMSSDIYGRFNRCTPPQAPHKPMSFARKSTSVPAKLCKKETAVPVDPGTQRHGPGEITVAKMCLGMRSRGDPRTQAHGPGMIAVPVRVSVFEALGILELKLSKPSVIISRPRGQAPRTHREASPEQQDK